MITGAEDAPWEGEGKQRLLRKLGALKRPVLGLLQRSPTARLTVDAFLECCFQVLSLTSESHTYTVLTETPEATSEVALNAAGASDATTAGTPNATAAATPTTRDASTAP
jgi:hypothetical protein